MTSNPKKIITSGPPKKPATNSSYSIMANMARTKGVSMKNITGQHPGLEDDAAAYRLSVGKPKKSDLAFIQRQALSLEPDTCEIFSDEALSTGFAKDPAYGEMLKDMNEVMGEKVDAFMKLDIKSMKPADIAAFKAVLGTMDVLSPETLHSLYITFTSKLNKATEELETQHLTQTITDPLPVQMARDLCNYSFRILAKSKNFGKKYFINPVISGKDMVKACTTEVRQNLVPGLASSLWHDVIPSVGGVLAASVFMRDCVLPVLATHAIPIVTNMFFSPDGNSTIMGTNMTGVGGRKRRTHKHGKKVGKRTKTHRRRHH